MNEMGKGLRLKKLTQGVDDIKQNPKTNYFLCHYNKCYVIDEDG